MRKYFKELFEDFIQALNELDRFFGLTMIVYDLTHSDHYMYPTESSDDDIEIIDLNSF